MSASSRPTYHVSLPVFTARPGWQGHLLWVVAAAVYGFAVSAVFSGLLEVPRSWLLVIYGPLTVLFLAGYARWGQVDLGGLIRRHWVWGLVGGGVAGTALVFGILNMDASPRPEGARLIFDLLWLGVVYGVVDALLLTVLPVLAVWKASKALGHTDGWPGRIVTGIAGFAASMVVTATYHLGYVEFRGTDVFEPLLGNGIMTLGYLLTANPLTAVIAHVAMHVASVIHGIDTTVTLPPHY